MRRKGQHMIARLLLRGDKITTESHGFTMKTLSAREVPVFGQEEEEKEIIMTMTTTKMTTMTAMDQFYLDPLVVMEVGDLDLEFRPYKTFLFGMRCSKRIGKSPATRCVKPAKPTALCKRSAWRRFYRVPTPGHGSASWRSARW